MYVWNIAYKFSVFEIISDHVRSLKFSYTVAACKSWFWTQLCSILVVKCDHAEHLFSLLQKYCRNVISAFRSPHEMCGVKNENETFHFILHYPDVQLE